MMGAFVLQNRFLAQVLIAQETIHNVAITFLRCTNECAARYADELVADQGADGGV